MQIGSITSIASVGQSLAVPAVSGKKSVSADAAPSAAPIASTKAVSSAPVQITSASKAATSGGGGSTSSQIANEVVSTVYSTTVGGKSYSGTILQEPPSGEYVASIPSLPGASASGTTLQAAESNLGTIIDTLA